eukprot:GHVP01070869.1.p1 GENE.GHVP01070869.1~~GHVP01070869.1.p1  ORF type:complete len:440 (-),score=148.54 GHVP01070869.1:131-1429(-)
MDIADLEKDLKSIVELIEETHDVKDISSYCFFPHFVLIVKQLASALGFEESASFGELTFTQIWDILESSILKKIKKTKSELHKLESEMDGNPIEIFNEESEVEDGDGEEIFNEESEVEVEDVDGEEIFGEESEVEVEDVDGEEIFGEEPEEEEDIDENQILEESEDELMKKDDTENFPEAKKSEEPNKFENSSLYDLSVLDDEERQLIEDKPLHMLGEMDAKKRERDGLLDIEVELPRSKLPRNLKSAATEKGILSEKIGTSSEETDIERINEFIDAIIVTRIKGFLFDDPERKAEPKVESGAAQEEVLNFEKSTEGLSKIYERKYEKEIFGLDREKNKEDKKKAEISQMLAKLFYKLDNLSNFSYMPMIQNSEHKNQENKVPIIRLEESIPIQLGISVPLPPKEPKKKNPKFKEKNAKAKATVRKKEPVTS